MEKLGHIGIVRVELNKVTRGYSRILKDTISTFRDATHFLQDVALDHPEMYTMSSRDSLSYMEKLTHATADNPEPEYPLFDRKFPGFPSYMRRSAVHAATGHVDSHITRTRQYHEKRDAEIARGHHYTRMEPRYNPSPNVCPTLYRKQSFSLDLEDRRVCIKVRIRNTWDWITLGIPGRDAKYLAGASALGTVKNPKLVYEYHKFYLEFPVKYKAWQFPDTPLEERTVLGTDLGFNSPAACSLTDIYGTVHGRAFAPFKADMGRIDHVINLIRKHQRLSGKGQSLSSLYTKLQGLKENYSRQLAHWVVELAVQAGAYGIVLEHLSGIHRRGGRRKGSLRARVQHWCVAKIRDYIKGLALRHGIRVFLINPNGTSKYAFDGSGPVERDGEDYSRCRFTTGKEYNADLSASYNIGARYFLREIKKSIPATGWSELTAKVPGLSKGTQWTLATLRAAYQAACQPAAD